MTTFHSLLGTYRLQWDLELNVAVPIKTHRDQVEDHGKGD
jgi:hypothetical protein